jgi:mono/diheme cytochrome c family protein
VRLLRVLACAAVAVFSAAAAAQGEHERRLAAELMVMAGDLRRIQSPDELPLHREGLRARLAGASSSLPLLLRRAGGCEGPPPDPRPGGRGDSGSLRSMKYAAVGLGRPGADCAAVPALRAALARGDWRALRAGLDALKKRHPFEAGALLPREATPERLRLGEAIHRQACAGCHDAPATGTKLPAFNLFEQAKRTPREEFAARLLIGVRGDRGTAWRNPFSDLELGALLAYYENGKSDAGGRR